MYMPLCTLIKQYSNTSNTTLHRMAHLMVICYCTTNGNFLFFNDYILQVTHKESHVSNDYISQATHQLIESHSTFHDLETCIISELRIRLNLQVNTLQAIVILTCETVQALWLYIILKYISKWCHYMTFAKCFIIYCLYIIYIYLTWYQCGYVCLVCVCPMLHVNGTYVTISYISCKYVTAWLSKKY